MLLVSVRNESASRFLEAQTLLSEIRLREQNENTATSSGLNIQKGLFLIVLYAAFEYTLTLLITRTAEYISAQNVQHSDLSIELFPLALDPQFKSISSTGRQAKWERRSNLLSKAHSLEHVRIHEEALLEELGNIWCKSLEQIFSAFGLTQAPLHDPRARQYIDELVERRNAVAHGRESATDVGSRYNATSLQLRLQEIEIQKNYLIDIFEDDLSNRRYLRISAT